VAGRSAYRIYPDLKQEIAVQATAGGQISLTDRDAHAMATNSQGTRIGGYNVQTAVVVKHQAISSAVA
jgi:hypothetical protein